MKKTFKIIAITCIVIILLVVIAGMYKFNYLSGKPGYDVDGNKIDNSNKSSMHWSWDLNNDGINDCENEGLCDDSVDYTQPKNSAEGLDCNEGNNIVFDKIKNQWVDCYGVCHTCTPENGFNSDGIMSQK
mgnify:CR=1 FL=1